MGIPFDPKNPIMDVLEAYPNQYILLYGSVQGSLSNDTDRIFSSCWDRNKIEQFDRTNPLSSQFGKKPKDESLIEQTSQKAKVDDFKSRKSSFVPLTLISLVLC